MDAFLLSRIQFGINISFHYLFPPMTIGLSWILVLLEGFYIKTKKPIYRTWLQFWTKIFALFFCDGSCYRFYPDVCFWK